MSLKLPQNASRRPGFRTGESILSHELIEEQAASLGAAGRLVERRMVELALIDQECPTYDALVQRAADAVFAFFVQRELCGLVDHSGPIDHFSIPKKVLARVGAR